MKRWILVFLFALIACGSSGALTLADDINQPPWLRFVPDTTYQNWTFSSDANPSAPDDGLYNLYGSPAATITGGTWSTNFDQHVGVWTLGADSSMSLFIPNTPADVTRHKDIQTQITWEPNGDNAPPVVMINGIASSPMTSAPVGTGNWIQSTYETRLEFNPASEQVIITGNYHLGEVVVDTQCVPEPSTLALLAMGAFSLAAFVRRRRS